jgi:hypothetical protein
MDENDGGNLWESWIMEAFTVAGEEFEIELWTAIEDVLKVYGRHDASLNVPIEQNQQLWPCSLSIKDYSNLA